MRERDGIVYCWPQDKQRKGVPPLVLRLLRFNDGRGAVYLVTNELNPRKLSDPLAGKIYRQRWGIEVYFFTLKSGLRLKRLQYRELSRYLNAAVLLLVVTWRVQSLIQVGRDAPETPCDQFFDSAEWKAACLAANPGSPLPTTAPTMGSFMLLLARLRGYIHTPA